MLKSESISPRSIVVLKATVDHEDPGEIVWSNVSFVNALFEELLTDNEIAADALQSYYVDYYLCEVNNGGFSQFVYNCRWSTKVVKLIRAGLQAIGANQHLRVFEQGAQLIETIGQDRLGDYFDSEYFGENADRDELNAINDAFFAAEEAEDLVALNAAWLRSHPDLCPLESEEEMLDEARRRGEALPDRAERKAAALASEPRYMKLIRALCDFAGQMLERVTAGDPTRIHQGERTLAWHFITNQGHHHMVDAGGKAIMFRGDSTTDVVCTIDAPEE